jgi:hypothetical protein
MLKKSSSIKEDDFHFDLRKQFENYSLISEKITLLARKRGRRARKSFSR